MQSNGVFAAKCHDGEQTTDQQSSQINEEPDYKDCYGEKGKSQERLSCTSADRPFDRIGQRVSRRNPLGASLLNRVRSST